MVVVMQEEPHPLLLPRIILTSKETGKRFLMMAVVTTIMRISRQA